MRLQLCLLIALLAVCASIAQAKERTWTSTDGRTMRAEFVRELDGEVTFLVAGKLTTIPLARLSDRDQQIVRDLAAGREVPDDPTPVPAPEADDPFSSPPRETTSPAESIEPDDRNPPATERAPPLTKRPITPTSRVWTDNQGRKFTGKFIRVFNGNVVTTRAGGPVTTPFYDLVEADQQYVRDVLTSRGEESLIPDRPPTPIAGTGEVASAPAGGPAFGPGTVPMPGYSPPAMPADSSSATAPMGYGPGGYLPSGTNYDTLTEHERRATDAASAAQRQADQMFRAQEEQMNRAMQSSSPLYQPLTQPLTQRVPVCSACRATLTDAEATGKRCPRCGAWWAYDTYHTSGSGTGSDGAGAANSGSQFEFLKDPQAKRNFYGGMAVLVALAVVLAIIIGVIAVAMAIASASRAGKRYNEAS